MKRWSVHKGDLAVKRRQAELIASRLPAGNVQASICCLPLQRRPSKQVACNMRLLPNVCRMLSRLCLCGTLPVACNSAVERLCNRSYVRTFVRLCVYSYICWCSLACMNNVLNFSFHLRIFQLQWDFRVLATLATLCCR